MHDEYFNLKWASGPMVPGEIAIDLGEFLPKAYKTISVPTFKGVNLLRFNYWRGGKDDVSCCNSCPPTPKGTLNIVFSIEQNSVFQQFHLNGVPLRMSKQRYMKTVKHYLYQKLNAHERCGGCDKAVHPSAFVKASLYSYKLCGACGLSHNNALKSREPFNTNCSICLEPVEYMKVFDDKTQFFHVSECAHITHMKCYLQVTPLRNEVADISTLSGNPLSAAIRQCPTCRGETKHYF